MHSCHAVAWHLKTPVFPRIRRGFLLPQHVTPRRDIPGMVTPARDRKPGTADPISTGQQLFSGETGQ
ncbi:hypothetical protein LHGZ1_0345 [Laribacter hongkongensis]|uniref:Uncharacterized protein n=1 Tax=Laribacter hongkongensis TaxID=168471 RepID=A0A248LFJ0_9NEIS|nr:hypothetical protein LHGZ1_0345 [Laribacter hongkongensis]